MPYDNMRDLSGIRANTLSGDDVSQAISLAFNINFYGTTTDDIYLCSNGFVSLASHAEYVPVKMDAVSFPIIAACWADIQNVDTNYVICKYGTSTLGGRPLWGAEWNGGTYSIATIGGGGVKFEAVLPEPDPEGPPPVLRNTNKFQLLIIDRSDIASGDFDLEFNYDQVLWDCANTQGGTSGLNGSSPATCGVSKGTSLINEYVELLGSGTANALINGGAQALITNSLGTSNSGRYKLEFRSGFPWISSLAGSGTCSGTVQLTWN